jgi:hypothetical protein
VFPAASKTLTTEVPSTHATLSLRDEPPAAPGSVPGRSSGGLTFRGCSSTHTTFPLLSYPIR